MSADKQNLRKWIQLTMFPTLDKLPANGKIKVVDGQYTYKGMASSSKLLTGVYGAVSRNDALFIADAYASRHQQVMLSMDLWYRIEDIGITRNQINESVVEKTGFIHVGGLSKSYREVIREMWVKWMRGKYDDDVLDEAREMDFVRLVTAFPEFIPNLFRAIPHLMMFVHQVRSDQDEDDSGKLIFVATVRNEPDRIMHMAVRYHSGIEMVL